MAAPHVSGALALLLAQGLSPSAAVDRLLGTLDHSVNCGLGCRGRLDLKAAVAAPAPAPSTTVAPGGGSAAPATAGGGSDDDLDPVLPGVALVLALLAAGATAGVWRRRNG
jgi:hypothetical protein